MPRYGGKEPGPGTHLTPRDCSRTLRGCTLRPRRSARGPATVARLTEPPRIDDPAYVAAEYADETRLQARIALWSANPGPQPRDVALERIRALAPRTALEVGCGQGEFAQTLHEHGIDVTAVDQSEQMVALTAARGVRAQRADVQDLPFADGSFDLAVANYMLYHVTDLPRGLRELARVLRSGGALVAITNSVRQLQEMWSLVGRRDAPGDAHFCRENAVEQLEPHFASVERVDVETRFTVTEIAIRDYLRATRFAARVDTLPPLPDGLTVTAAGSVLIATT